MSIPKYNSHQDIGNMDRQKIKAAISLMESAIMALNEALDGEDGGTPANDGWIEWHGGECPVDPKTAVEVKFWDGEYCLDSLAEEWYWGDSAFEDTIVAYRIVRGDKNQHPMAAEMLRDRDASGV